MLPFSKHCCYVCWVTILTSVPMMSILLTDWTLMPTLGSFAATLYCSLVSFFAFSYQLLASTMEDA